ncbi:hypothetical protein ACFLZK_02715, partial [Patescibacteria group bacterium]
PLKKKKVKEALRLLGRATLQQISDKLYEMEKADVLIGPKKQAVPRWPIEEVHKHLIGEKWATPDANVVAKSKDKIEFVWTPNVRDQKFYGTYRPGEN